MNERMNQLQTEAARYAKEKYPSDIVKWSLCMSEKFAELIVKECCEQSMSIGRYNTPSGTTPDLAIAISVGLKKHFGVEELQQPIDFETQDPETAKGTKVEHFGVEE